MLRKQLIRFASIVLVSTILLSVQHLYHLFWYILAFAIVLLFTYQAFGSKLVNPKRVSSKKYKRSVFRLGFILRLFFGILIVLDAYITKGSIFYINAVDAVKYNRIATYVADAIQNFDFNLVELVHPYYPAWDDKGFAIILGFLYSITFSHPFVAKLFMIIIGSYVAVFAYKIARHFFTEEESRLTGLIFALFPLSFYYSGILLKASLIVFFIFSSIYRTLQINRGNNKLKNTISLLLSLLLLSTLRSAFAIIVAVSILFWFISIAKMKRKAYAHIFRFAAIGLLILYVISESQPSEQYAVTNLAQSPIEIAQSSYQNVMRELPAAAIGSFPIFAAIGFFAPFPSIANVDKFAGLSHDVYAYYISGVIVWNFLAFFSLYGLWMVFKKRRNETSLLWLLSLGVLAALIVSVKFTSVRFSYASISLFLLFSGYGINLLKKNKKIYMVGIGIAILAWNYFRLASRGMI
jgi:hypothetical protein